MFNKSLTLSWWGIFIISSHHNSRMNNLLPPPLFKGRVNACRISSHLLNIHGILHEYFFLDCSFERVFDAFKTCCNILIQSYFLPLQPGVMLSVKRSTAPQQSHSTFGQTPTLQRLFLILYCFTTHGTGKGANRIK